MNPLWDEFDIARALGTTPAMVRRLVRDEGLPHIEVPRVGNRFQPTAVIDWLKRRQRPAEGGRDAGA